MNQISKKPKKKVIGPCEEKLDCKTLTIEGTEYFTQLNTKFENRKIWQKPDPKLIKSYIPGTILEIFIKEGDVVKAGEPLVILEAMKMRNVVVMPLSGMIKAINVAVGDKIPKGLVIIEIS